MATEKRKRAKAFQPDESHLLVQLVTNEADIVECKRTDKESRASKNEAWKRIVELFNKISTSTYRPVDQLQNRWENMKGLARTYIAEHRRQMYITGAREVEKDDLMEMVVAVIRKSAQGYENPYDGDSKSCPLVKKTKTSEIPTPNKGHSKENEIENCEAVFQHVRDDAKEISSWNKWSKDAAKKPVSHPRVESIKKVPRRQSINLDNARFVFLDTSTQKITDRSSLEPEKSSFSEIQTFLATVGSTGEFDDIEKAISNCLDESTSNENPSLQNGGYVEHGESPELGNLRTHVKEKAYEQPNLKRTMRNLNIIETLDSSPVIKDQLIKLMKTEIEQKLPIEIKLLQAQLKKIQLECEVLELQKHEMSKSFRND